MTLRRRRERLTLLAAIVLLVSVAVGWWLLTSRREEVREAALAGVPEFPTPGQAEVRYEPNRKLPARPGPPIAQVAPPPRKMDRITAFALAPAHTVAVIQVNALFNTPLYARFKQCAPPELKEMESKLDKHGIDLERDIDRIALVPGGVAVNGFFEGKPLAELYANEVNKSDAAPVQSTYRDQTIWTLPNGSCISQLGNLMVMGQSCQTLIDRALDPPGDDADAEDLYGDVFLRTNPGELPQGDAQRSSQAPFDQLFNDLAQITLRANVWDDVAVSLEGTPNDPNALANLSQMARGALALAKTQVDDGDDKLQALADLAKVNSQDGQLKIDLALPADDLFSRFHIPCPGLEGDAGAEPSQR